MLFVDAKRTEEKMDCKKIENKCKECYNVKLANKDYPVSCYTAKLISRFKLVKRVRLAKSGG